jgi:hypothetical protein
VGATSQHQRCPGCRARSAIVRATRDSYDATVAEYTEMDADLLDAKPLDRALRAVFAELVRANGNDPVADIGSRTSAADRAE